MLGIAAGYLGTEAYGALDLVGLRFDAYELAQSNRFALFAYAVFGIGLVEESVKFIPFVLVVMRIRHFDEPLDGVVYASFIGLGFASYENLHYMTLLEGREMLIRGIASPLVHAMFASVWGYGCARAVLSGRPLWPAACLSLMLACTIHGLYDFLIIAGVAWVRPMAALLILVVWVWRMHLIRRLLGRDRDQHG